MRKYGDLNVPILPPKGDILHSRETRMQHCQGTWSWCPCQEWPDIVLPQFPGIEGMSLDFLQRFWLAGSVYCLRFSSSKRTGSDQLSLLFWVTMVQISCTLNFVQIPQNLVCWFPRHCREDIHSLIAEA